MLCSPRGVGTLCAVNCTTIEVRAAIVAEMRTQGILLGACGTHTIRFRPPLVFTEKHAAIVIDRFRKAVAVVTATHPSLDTDVTNAI